jgi:hypothetical protein
VSIAVPCKTPFTGDSEADRLVEKDGFALLTAMILETGIPMVGPPAARQRDAGLGLAWSRPPETPTARSRDSPALVAVSHPLHYGLRHVAMRVALDTADLAERKGLATRLMAMGLR